MKRAAFLFVLLAVSICAGCSPWKSIKSSWYSTKEFLTPRPQVELDLESLEDENFERLAKFFTPVDEQITDLEKSIAVQQDYPEPQWFAFMNKRFPWLGGLATVDASGSVLQRVPESSVKNPTFEPLIKADDLWLDHKLRAEVVPTDFGPEVLLGTAFTKDRVWLGITVAHFDFRSLMKEYAAANELVVLTTNSVLWYGKSQTAAQALAEQPWDKILEDDIHGELTLENGDSYVWIARYLGGISIVYLMETTQS